MRRAELPYARHRREALLIVCCLVLCSACVATGYPVSDRAAHAEMWAQADGYTFPETGKTVSGRFLQYWNAHGGLVQQGYPISEQMEENSDTDGKVYMVQYFERAVFELHGENQPPNDVLLSLLGRFRYERRYPQGAPGQTASSDKAARFPQTGKTLGGKFRAYWESHGGLAQQGYPISEEFREKSDLDGKTYTVQYFERSVFEYHPENKAPFDVLLSQLGTFRYKDIYGTVSGGRGGDTNGGVVYTVPGMDKVKVQKEIIYKSAGGEQLKMDVYSPPDLKPGEVRPVVVLGHGRGGKDSPPWVSWGQLLAASGYIAVTFNYRDPPGSVPANIISDIQDLISYVRANNSTLLNVDKDRVGVLSFSALVRHHVSAAMRGTPPYIKAIVGYYGWLDDEQQQISPLYVLQHEQGPFAPMFIAKAGRDSHPSINSSIDQFVQAARAKNLDLVYMVHGEGAHGFDTLNNNEKSRQIIVRTLEFLRDHLQAH